MSIAPIFTSPCDLAQRMPAMVSDFLNLENKVGRRFREDSVTDILIASLLRIAGSNVTVFVPPELRSGGDFDIMIVEPSTGEAVQYRIQAKRLYPHPTEWSWGVYRELAHPHNSGAQSSTLVRSAAREKITTIPLYAFYNPEAACLASGGRLSGVELAGGREINKIVRTLVRAKPKKPRFKRVEYLIDLFFPLAILCPPKDSAGSSTDIIAPQVSREAVEKAIAARVQPGWTLVEGQPRLSRRRPEPLSALRKPEAELPTAPPLGSSPAIERRFPPLVQRAVNRVDDEQIQVSRVPRPKIILISGPRIPDVE